MARYARVATLAACLLYACGESHPLSFVSVTTPISRRHRSVGKQPPTRAGVRTRVHHWCRLHQVSRHSAVWSREIDSVAGCVRENGSDDAARVKDINARSLALRRVPCVRARYCSTWTAHWQVSSLIVNIGQCVHKKHSSIETKLLNRFYLKAWKNSKHCK